MQHLVAILAILGICGALYLGSAVLIPIALALYGAILLLPVVGRLQRWGMSRLGATGAVMLLVTLVSGTLVNFTLEPARTWIERAPSVLSQVELKLRPIQQAAGRLNRVAEHAERLAGQNGDAKAPVAAPAATAPSGGVLVRLLRIAVPTIGVFFLVFFLLACGPPILQRLADGYEPALARRLVVTAERIRREMGRYLATLATINVVLGAATAGICVVFDLPNPLLWGVMAGLFNFVPYVGSTATLLILSLVAVLTHGLGPALGVAISYLALDMIEGQLVQPMLVGNRLSLNPLAIFLALWIGAGLWGLAGLLLATPVLLTVRIICRHMPRCHALNAFLAPARERPLAQRARAWRRHRRRRVRAIQVTPRRG